MIGLLTLIKYIFGFMRNIITIIELVQIIEEEILLY